MPAVAIATLIALMLEVVSAKGAALALVLAVDVSASVTADNTYWFPTPSFQATVSGAQLTGGKDAVYTTVYDSGIATLTVNSHVDSYSWSGSGTTAANIASGLASAINNDSGAGVTAVASGSTITLTAKASGTVGNVSLGCSSSYDSSHFSSAAFGI